MSSQTSPSFFFGISAAGMDYLKTNRKKKGVIHPKNSNNDQLDNHGKYSDDPRTHLLAPQARYLFCNVWTTKAHYFQLFTQVWSFKIFCFLNMRHFSFWNKSIRVHFCLNYLIIASPIFWPIRWLFGQFRLRRFLANQIQILKLLRFSYLFPEGLRKKS